MTLAVIVGLCCTLAPGVWAGNVAGVRFPAALQQAAQDAVPQESAKPAEPTSQQPAGETATTPPANTTKQKPAATTPATPAKKTTHKKKTAAKASHAPAKVVVPNGSTSDPPEHFSSGHNPAPPPDQVQGINQLLDATESNLKQISGRTLSAAQQDTVTQIRAYMDQARKAVDSGDGERGRNLAVKAHLLSDDLVKH